MKTIHLLSMLAVLLAGWLQVGQILPQTETARAPAWAQDHTNTEPPWWQEPNVFSVAGGPDRRLVDNLVRTSVKNGVLIAELTWQQQYNWREVGRMHAEGRRVVGAISTNGSTYQAYVERPELVAAAVIDIYGRPLIQQWKPTPEGPVWWGNTIIRCGKRFFLSRPGLWLMQALTGLRSTRSWGPLALSGLVGALASRI